mgnify:CR=1 FL=1
MKIKGYEAKWFLLFIATLFVLLRVPSLIEPHWYGDEGIYQVVGREILKGEILYKDIWDNKPPFLYAIYAIFNGNLFFVKLASLTFGLLSVFSFYILTTKVFEKIFSRFTSCAVFAILFALPFLEGNIANAENFMLLPITLGAYFILVFKDSRKAIHLILAGFLLSIAFITKIVAIFDFFAFFIFLGILLWNKYGKSALRFKNLKNHALFSLSFVSLLILSSIYFLLNGALGDFLNAVFAQNVNYVNVENRFIVPYGILFVKTLLLLTFIVFLFKKRNIIKSHELFIYLWLGFSVYSAFFSQRPYIHYILVMLPAFSLLCGIMVESKKRLNIHILVLVGLIFLSFYHLTFYKKTFEYYVNYLQFIFNKKTITEYQRFFDSQTPRDYEIANFINANLKKDETFFLWSDSAQIYALADKSPIGKYVVAYHITFYKDADVKIKEAIDSRKPRLIIQTAKVEFPRGIISNYSLRYEITGAKIYEREL